MGRCKTKLVLCLNYSLTAFMFVKKLRKLTTVKVQSRYDNEGIRKLKWNGTVCSFYILAT